MTNRPLKLGDEIRVIAPSQSKRASQKKQYERARERLEKLGYKVTFGKYIGEKFYFGTATAEQRAEDFNNAVADKNVKAIMALNGGWSANEILPLINWEDLQSNPKPLIGYSDITVLLNAIYAKTGAVGYLGPNFGTLGSMISWQYSLNNLNAVLQQDSSNRLAKSKEWGVKGRKRRKTKVWKVLQPGVAEATLLGGNLGTFYLLQGTEYQPSLSSPYILAIEDDDESGQYTAREFSRRLESILQLSGARENLKGVLIGRFQPDSKVRDSDVASIVASKQLGNIPVVAGFDFGHTLPMLTLPIGGKVKLNADKTKIDLTILKV